MLQPSPLWVLAGPTASGKTAISLALARELGAEILSADSMCVYRGMDVGTAKPTPQERAGIPHHGIDVVEPTADFSVAEYCRMGWNVLADCQTRHVPVIVVGGTGYYIRGLIDGMRHGPPPNPDLRARLEAFADTQGNAALLTRLAQVDPARAAQLHVNDRKRIIRALEVYDATGQPMSDSLLRSAPPPMPTSHARFVGLRRGRADTVARIAARTRQLFDAGLLDEVARLQAQGVTLRHTAFQGHGYKEVVLGLQAGKSPEAIMEDVAIATRRYARRQMTWFKADRRMHWIDIAPDEPAHETAARILDTLDTRDSFCD